MFLIWLLLWTGALVYGTFQVGMRFFGVNLFSAEKFHQLIWLIPVWLVGLIILLIFFKKKKSKKIIQQAVADHPFVPVKGFVPNAMPSQGKSMSFAPQITNAIPQQNSVSASAPVSSVSTPAPTFQNNLESQAIQEITQLTEAKGLTPFPHVLLENIMLPLTVSSDVKALLFKFVSASGVWHVDENSDLAASLWTNQGYALPLLKDLIKAKDTLLQMEPSAEAIPVVVLLDGDVENEAHIQDYLNQSHVRIVRLKHKENSALMDVSELLDKEFTEEVPPMPTLKGEENNEEQLTSV